jgi:hypothetical protein
MTPTERPISHKVLLVDDDDAIRGMMTATLEHKGFEVVAAANVTEALKLITTETFDVLITDLHMPNPSDGFAVKIRRRHSADCPDKVDRYAPRCGCRASFSILLLAMHLSQVFPHRAREYSPHIVFPWWTNRSTPLPASLRSILPRNKGHTNRFHSLVCTVVWSAPGMDSAKQLPAA